MCFLRELQGPKGAHAQQGHRRLPINLPLAVVAGPLKPPVCSGVPVPRGAFAAAF
jgi:hypothetical protein